MKVLGKLLIALALFAFPMSAAQAHAQLVSSTPAAGEVINALPPQILLSFDDPLIALGSDKTNEIKVYDSEGKLISSRTSITKGRTVSVALLTSNVTGAVDVAWRVVADDGHPTQGAFTFTVSKLPRTLPVKSDLPRKETSKGKSEPSPFFLILPLFLAVFIKIRRGRDQ